MLTLMPMVKTFTWANKPAANTVPAGYKIRVTGLLPSPLEQYFYSDGTNWYPDGNQITYARTAVSATTTGSTSEIVLATISMKGNIMLANSQANISSAWSSSGTAGTRTIRFRLGGEAGTIICAASLTAAAVHTMNARLSNRNSVSSQYCRLETLINASGTVTSATDTADMSTDKDIVITAQSTSAADSITLESYLVEVFA